MPQCPQKKGCLGSVLAITKRDAESNWIKVKKRGMDGATSITLRSKQLSQRDALQGLSDKGIVQLTHVVSDFSSYNTLNLALDADYDYRNSWRELAGFSAAT